jgi:hypothetical protein
MEAAGSSEMPVLSMKVTLDRILEDGNLNTNSSENLKHHVIKIVTASNVQVNASHFS